MHVTIGTFNLNNLFSRYNFKGEIDAVHDTDTSVDSELKYEFGPDDTFRIRTYVGRLVKAKDIKDTERIATRIKSVLQRLAADPSRDPVLVARLERWNELLSRAFEASPEDGRYRDAVREAALDVQRRAPAGSLDCVDEKGEPARCDTTEAVLRSLGRRRDSAGIRGALARLLERIFRRDGS